MSAVLILALALAGVHTALLTFVTVLAVLSNDKGRRKAALAVLRILASRPIAGRLRPPRNDRDA